MHSGARVLGGETLAASLFLLRGLCYLFPRCLRQREQQDFSPGKLGVGLTQWVGVPRSTVKYTETLKPLLSNAFRQ